GPSFVGVVDRAGGPLTSPASAEPKPRVSTSKAPHAALRSRRDTRISLSRVEVGLATRIRDDAGDRNWGAVPVGLPPRGPCFLSVATECREMPRETRTSRAFVDV